MSVLSLCLKKKTPLHNCLTGETGLPHRHILAGKYQEGEAGRQLPRPLQERVLVEKTAARFQENI